MDLFLSKIRLMRRISRGAARLLPPGTRNLKQSSRLGGRTMSSGRRAVKNLQGLLAAVVLALATAPTAAAQSRNETLIVVVESGPNTMDIHGLGANRPS